MDKAKISKALLAFSAMLSVLSFSVYYIVALNCDKLPDFVSKYIYRDCWLACFSLVFLGVGMIEQKTWLKFMVYYSASFFFSWTLLIYTLNDIHNFSININVPIVSSIFTTVSCYITYFAKCKRHKNI